MSLCDTLERRIMQWPGQSGYGKIEVYHIRVKIRTIIILVFSTSFYMDYASTRKEKIAWKTKDECFAYSGPL